MDGGGRFRSGRLGESATSSAGLEVVTLDAYDPALDPVAAAATAGRFTVARDATFYRWRIDRYPLARARYVALRDGGETVAFAALRRFATPPRWPTSLLRMRLVASAVDATFAVATAAGARTVTVEIVERGRRPRPRRAPRRPPYVLSDHYR